MKIFIWEDRREPGPPRVMVQNGDCTSGFCNLWAISISDGSVGMTARFESREEFELFLRLGELTEKEASDGRVQIRLQFGEREGERSGGA